MALSYVDAVSNGFPGVTFSTSDAGTTYETINWISGNPPTKEELDAYILEDTKTEMWRKIQTLRDTKKAGGAKVGSYWFHSDDTSRIQYIGLLMYGANMPSGIMWKTMTGDFVEMTPTLVQQIFGTIATKDTQIFSIAEQHRMAMLASEMPENYDYLNASPVWPLMYGE